MVVGANLPQLGVPEVTVVLDVEEVVEAPEVVPLVPEVEVVMV